MTKGSLALLYFPGSNPRIATRHLMRWINGCPPLMEELSATGYHTSQKVFTSRQVTLCNVNNEGADTLLTFGLACY